MTKAKFIAAYIDYVSKNYEWAADPAKLDGFIAVVKQTLFTERTTWVWDGAISKAVWKAIGGKGKLTLKGLRALPAE